MFNIFVQLAEKQDLGKEGIENYCFMETVSVCEGANILKMHGGNDCTTMCMYLMLVNYTCKNG